MHKDISEIRGLDRKAFTINKLRPMGRCILAFRLFSFTSIFVRMAKIFRGAGKEWVKETGFSMTLVATRWCLWFLILN